MRMPSGKIRLLVVVVVFCAGILNADDFAVLFDRRPLAVEKARHSAFPMNQTWPGYERPVSQSKVDAFVKFDVAKPGELSVLMPEGCDASSVRLRPYSHDGLRHQNGMVVLRIDKPGHYVVDFGEEFPSLHVFADPPFERTHVPDEIYFGPGVHDAGLIEPRSGQTVCIDSGAVVYGAIYLNHVTNVMVTGRGILDGSRIRRTSADGHYLRDLTADDRAAMRDVTLFTCLWSKDVSVSGIVLRDSPFWTMLVRNSGGIEIDGVQIVGQWRYNSDGIDICGCEDVVVRNSFIRSFDDSFVVRDGGLAWGREPVPSRNIVCRNCMLWSDWGSNFKAQIGGTRDALIENVTVANSVFAHVDSGGVIIAARPGGKDGIVRDIRVEDIEYDFAPNRYAHQWQNKNVRDEVFVKRRIDSAKLFEICNYGFKEQDVSKIELLFDRIAIRRIRAFGDYGRLDAVVRLTAARECVRDLVVEDVPPRVMWTRKATFAASDGNGVSESVQQTENIRRTVRGTTLVDFGKAAFGWVEVDFEKGGYELRIGEKLDADGCVDMKPGGTIRFAKVSGESFGLGFERVPLVADERNTKGVNRTTHAYPIPERFGVVMPFRYVEVVKSSSAVAAANVRRTVLHWPVDMAASSFKCDDERLNKVYDFCKHSIWATSFAGVYVDGDRERIPYEADAYINQVGHYAIDADFEMGRRTFAWLMDHPTWPTEWAQHMIMMAWADWMYSGETNLIARYYNRLRDEKLLLNLARQDGLIVSYPDHSRLDQGDIVDWPAGERDGFVFEPVNAVVNAFHYRNLCEMRDIAAALGKADDAEFFAKRAVKVRESYNRAFFGRETGLYVDGEGTAHSSLHANAAALAFGLVPAECKDGVADFLASKGMACSVYFSQYLLESLFESGRAEDAIRLMSSGGERSWLGMMEQGSTITMEAWSLGAKPNQDWNHAWGTPPLNIISRYVLGIKPLRPGFSEVSMSPQIGKLKHVEGRVPTPHGAISVRISDGAVNYSAPEAIKVQDGEGRRGRP